MEEEFVEIGNFKILHNLFDSTETEENEISMTDHSESGNADTLHNEEISVNEIPLLLDVTESDDTVQNLANAEFVAVSDTEEQFVNTAIENTEQKHSDPDPINVNQFIEIDDNDVENFIAGQQNKNTVKKTMRDLNIVKKFLKLKNEERDITSIPPTELDPLLANFVLAVRKHDGGEFEPTTIRSIISSVDRKFKRQKYGFKIMNSDTDNFELTRQALKAKMKSLKKQGKGNRPNKSQPLSDTEINILYERGLLGDTNPEALLNTMWFNNCIHFGLRGVQEHYSLRWGDISLKMSADGTEYLELNERESKTRSGENLTDVREVAPKMFAVNCDRNPVKFYKTFASKRPADFCNENDPFYISTRTIPLDDSRSDKWFIKQKVGQKKLSSIMKSMASKADLNSGKKLTNHSTRKTLVQKLRSENVPVTDVMQISGHKNVQSVLNYSSITEDQQRIYSNILSDTHQNNGNLNESFSQQGSRTENINNLNIPTCMNFQYQESHTCNKNSQFNSLFFGATLHVTNMNIYTAPFQNQCNT